MEGKKRYGLFLSRKDLPSASNEVIKKPAIFNEDSGSDDDSNVDWVKKSLMKEPYGGGARTRQSKAEIQKVLAEDPTAYQYDEVYDELQKNINDTLAAKKVDRQPKYVQLLLAQADRRKRENERRLARQIQKERAAEGDEFADKEVFVTSAYQKKLEEMKKMDEEDKHMEMLEDIGDVAKQKDMTGFYRHLYRATVSKEDLRNPPPELPRISVKSEPRDDDKLVKPKQSTQPRQFRKRKSSESSDSEKDFKKKPGETDGDCVIDPSLDADSDVSEKEENEVEKSKMPQDTETKSAEKDDNDNNTDNKDDVKQVDGGENKENVEETKPKVSIWVKRTVGEVFDAALERYHHRKAARLATNGS